MAIIEEGKMDGESFLTTDSSRSQPSLWRDPSFDAIEFIRNRLSFLEDLPINYKGLHNMSPLELSSMA